MTENNIKPSEVLSFYKIISDLKEKGLDVKDIIKLIQRRTTPQLPMNAIRNTLNAIEKLERDVTLNRKKRGR